VVDPSKKVLDLKCEVTDLLLKVVDLKQEVPDLRSGGIPLNLTPASTLLLNGRVSVRPYICQSVPLIDSAATSRWFAAARARAADIDR